MRPLQSAFSFPLRCTVFLQNADPSLLTWLCTSLSASFASVELSCSLTTLVLQAVCSKSASLHPADELRSARGRASVCCGPCCESSSGPSVLTVALVESLQFSAQPFSPPETLRHHIDKKFPGCPHFTWDTSLAELEMQISQLFSL